MIAHIHLEAPNWYQVTDLFVSLFLESILFVDFEEEDSLENLRILSCFVFFWLESVQFNPFCVFDLLVRPNNNNNDKILNTKKSFN